MLNYSREQLVDLGAEITTREIHQQPQVWQAAFDAYRAHQTEIEAFIDSIDGKYDYVKVIFTGAGTSAYVGDTLIPYLRSIYDERKWNFNSVATTDIVANPLTHLRKDVPTVLVSFARSGNSPESVATVDLAKQLVDELYQVTITCAAEGKLAQQAHGDDRNLLLLQPSPSNDAGFAMTSSFTSMMLTALLVFDKSELAVKEEKVASLIALSQQTLDRVDEIQNLANLDFNRVIYLGAGPFFGLAHEAQLKILELTAGQVATDPYTKQYDLDLVREVAGDEIARKVILLTDKAEGLAKVEEVEMASELLDDIYRTFPYIIYGQLFALLTSLKVKNRPDTPSPTGTVNRVVQGVVIHPFAK